MSNYTNIEYVIIRTYFFRIKKMISLQSKNKKMTRIIIVDDHKLFRFGIRGILEGKHEDIIIAGDVEDGNALFQLLKTTPADLILLDIYLPGMGGVEIAEQLRKEYPKIKILVFSCNNSPEVINRLLSIGIDGFISKQMSSEIELIEAIRAVMNGMEYFGRDIASIICNIYISVKKTMEVTPEFTNQEKHIIDLCHKGLLAKEIAYQLNINYRTVEKHKENIFRKLGINNTMEMVQYAINQGIISS